MDKTNGTLSLAAIRSSRGITLEQIAESTKISTRSLRAIEDGEFKKLPGGIYNTSYIKQYARAIGFDESELLAFYFSQVGLAAEAPPARRIGGDMFGTYRPASTPARP